MSAHYGREGDQRAAATALFRRARSSLSPSQQRLFDELLEGPKDTSELAQKFKTKKANILADLSKARVRLGRYYLSPQGLSEKLKLELPIMEETGMEGHSIRVADNVLDGAIAFWAAHLGNGKPTRIVTGRPDFLHVPYIGMMLRHEFFNGLSEEFANMLRKSFQDLSDAEMKPVQPYIALSDVQAMLDVYSYLDWWRRQYGHLSPELWMGESDPRSDDANLFVLGTPFDNRWIAELENEAKGVDLPHRGSLYLGRDGVSFSKRMPNGEYRVWVHRRSVGSHCETLVNAPTSEVLGPVCSFLTSDESIRELIGELSPAGKWTGFPDEFQIQLRVKMSADLKRVKRIRVQQYLRGESLRLIHPDDESLHRKEKDYGTEADWGYGEGSASE
jgi:hypothetical protein